MAKKTKSPATEEKKMEVRDEASIQAMHEAESSDSSSEQKTDEMIVVGIGASAGGLEALQNMVANLPVDLNAAYILAQHLSPTYKSMMVDLLEKESTIPVVAAKDGAQLEANTLYICPPSYNIEVADDNSIVLNSAVADRHIPRPSVDILFESLAFAKGDSAIAVVLSGTGTDGSHGIRAIKGEGGWAIAQEPNTAKYDGMPNSAINAGNIDLILPPSEIGPELKNLIRFPRVRPEGFDTIIAREDYFAILSILKRRFKVDFAQYKESTIMRRIERRLAALKLKRIKPYITRLQEDKNESELLFNDMLIGVTSFFRDRTSFIHLQEYLEGYIKLNKEGKNIRIWVPGCSTGEEPYSIAIILSEILGKQLEDYKVQIFATDVDQQAIEFARTGIYPESALKNVAEFLRHKYFTMAGEQFQIIKPIKSMVIFSLHDVTMDPPFLRLDLISCRNLLIYFGLELQRQVMPIFHYALNTNGLLFLGKSETTGVFQEKFRTLSKKDKIYEASFTGSKSPPPRRVIRNLNSLNEDMPVEKHDSKNKLSSVKQAENSFSELISTKIKDLILENVVLINDTMDIVYTVGENPMLQRPEGLPTNNIFQNLNPVFSVDLRSALHDLEKGDETTRTAFQRIEVDEEVYWGRLILMDVKHQKGMGRLIVIFCQVEDVLDLPLTSESKELDSHALASEQERQLLKTKEQLQTVIEELETSNEEMQSMNEELQSSNEELQSSNEELETTNEELQSTNEELQTAYAELRVAYEEKDRQQMQLSDLKEQLENANALLTDAERSGMTGSLRWHVRENQMEWTQGVYRLLGLNKDNYPPTFEAFVGRIHADWRKPFEDFIEQILEGASHTSFQFKMMGENKTTIWIDMVVTLSYNKRNQPEFLMGTLRNASSIVEAELKAEQLGIMLNALLETKFAGLYIYNFTTKSFDFINDAYSAILGYSRAELNAIKGDVMEALVHEDDLVCYKKHRADVYNSEPGQTFSEHFRMLHKDGRVIMVINKESLYEVNTDSGKHISLVGNIMELEDSVHALLPIKE